MVYDSRRDRLVVTGGFNANRGHQPSTSVLPLSGEATWAAIPHGIAETDGIVWGRAVYDSLHDQVFLFGGFSSSNTRNTKLYRYDLGRAAGWELIPAGNLPQADSDCYEIAYDAPRNRIVLLVTAPLVGSSVSAWQLSLAGGTSWTPLPVSGPPPVRRSSATTTLDPVANRLVLCGGFIPPGNSEATEVWGLQLGATCTWARFPISGPARYYRSSSRAIWDRAGNRLVAWGAQGTPIRRVFAGDVGGLPAPQLDPTSWTTVLKGSRAPEVVLGTRADLALDPSTDELVIYVPDQGLGNEVWTWPLSGASPLRLLEVTGLGGFLHTYDVVLDPILKRLVYVGFAAPASNRTRALELHVPNPAWTTVNETGAGRYRPQIIHDPSGHRFVSYADDGVVAIAPAGTLEWATATPPGLTPFPRRQASTVYDPDHDSMLLFGGHVTCLCDPNDGMPALQLSGSPAWIRIPYASGARPSPRKLAALAFDSRRHRFLMFGGSSQVSDDNLFMDMRDLWEFRVADSVQWRPLFTEGDGPPAYALPDMVYDHANDRLLLHAGGEVIWSLAFPAPAASAPEQGRSAIALSVSPTPSASRTLLAQWTMPTAGPAELEVLDLAGRRVWHRDLGLVPAGGRAEAVPLGRQLQPGLYFLRWRSGSESSVARVVLTK